jgi:hypothetical protein
MKTNQTDDRVAELEAQVAQLKTELAMLRPEGPNPPSAPYIEQGTVVTVTPLATGRPEDFPTKGQLNSLLNYVLTAYPKLGVDADVTGFREHFERAFLALCYIRRRDGIDKQHTMSFWRDLGQDTLSSLKVPAKLELAPFVAAVIAHGDIAHTHPNHPQNFSMSAGLIFGGVGRAYNGVWKKVIEAGRVNAPVEISIPRNVMSQNVVIIGGGRGVGQRW